MEQIELTDGRLVVRSYRDGDAPRLFEAVRESIAEVSRWLPWCHENYSIEESREFIRLRTTSPAEEWYSFGVFARNDDTRLLGGVGLNFINRVHQFGNLGYWVRTGETGKGIASDASRLVARFGLEEVGLQRIEILTAVSNRASQRVAEKIGAVREGLLRKRLLIRDEPHDAVMFSLVRGDL